MAALALAGAACEPVDAPHQPTEQLRRRIEERVPDYFRKKANLPDTLTIRILDVRPSTEVPGLLAATMELSQGGQSQTYPLILSRDGRYVVQGQWGDTWADPYEENRRRLRTDGAPARGAAAAPVTIVAFLDFQCPYCARAHRTLQDQLLKEDGDRVRLVVKHLPLSSIHPWAEAAAVAAACAGDQDPKAFWTLADFFFRNQPTITRDTLRERAVGAAREAGLDTGRFAACLDAQATLPAVRADQAEAEALGVRSTPTFFINGRRLEGALPVETLRAAVDAALAAAATPAAPTGTPAPTATPAAADTPDATPEAGA